MNPILISPHIDGETTSEQLRQMKSYLYQFKEQIEMILSNIDTDNFSPKTQGFFDTVTELEKSSKIKMGNYSSEIKQLANEISLIVEREGQTSSRLTVAEGAITAEVSRAKGAEESLSASLAITDSAVSAKVSFNTQYNGIKITRNGVFINGNGTFQVDMSNFKVDANGNVTITGEVNAKSGTIGGWNITNGVIQKGFASLEPDYIAIGTDIDNNTAISSGEIDTHTVRIATNLTVLGSMNWGRYFVQPSEIDGEYYLKVVGYRG